MRLRRWIFRAPVLGTGTTLVIAAGAYQVTQAGAAPPGRILDAACAWHGRDVALTGVVHNSGSSSADFPWGASTPRRSSTSQRATSARLTFAQAAMRSMALNRLVASSAATLYDSASVG